MTIAEAQAAFPEPLMIPGRFRVRVIRGCGIRDGPRPVPQKSPGVPLTARMSSLIFGYRFWVHA